MTAKVLDNLKYTTDHDWVLLENDTATIGITDFAQASLGDIVFVELPEVGATYSAGDSFGVVESIKSVTDLHLPIAGEILEINEQISDEPELCNKAPFESWLVKVKPNNIADLESLMSPEDYTKHCDSIE